MEILWMQRISGKLKSLLGSGDWMCKMKFWKASRMIPCLAFGKLWDSGIIQALS